MMKLAIIDLDGTLFDERHRNHLAVAKDWDEYHKHHKGDGIFANVLAYVRKLAVDHEIVFLTGRTENYRQSTMEQLVNLKVASLDLIMRPVDNHRSSADYKAQALEDLITTNSVGFVAMVDDCARNLDKMAAVCANYDISWTAHLAKDGLLSFHGGCDYNAPMPTADILRSMADTFEERNKIYGSNYERVAPIMKILFPDGLPPEILHSDQWHLFELIVVKLTRFAISGLQHKDSIHDTGVYAAMIESILEKKNG